MSRRPRKQTTLALVRSPYKQQPSRPPSVLEHIATIIGGAIDGLVARSLRVWLSEKPGRRMVVSSTADGLDLKFYDGAREVDAPISFDISKGFFQ